MKMLFENWRGFVNEEVKVSDEDLYSMWLSALEEEGIITISDPETSPELNEQDDEDEESLYVQRRRGIEQRRKASAERTSSEYGEETMDVDALKRSSLDPASPDVALYPGAKVKTSVQKTDSEGNPLFTKTIDPETGKPKPKMQTIETVPLEPGKERVPIINLTPDFLPNDDESSGFCLYNSEINDFARQTPDNFAQVVMFVMATIQVNWSTFIPNFKFCVDFLKKYGEFPPPGKSTAASPGGRVEGLDFVLSDSSKFKMKKYRTQNLMGKKEYKRSSKRGGPYKDYKVSGYRQNILTALSNPKDPLFPSLDVDKEEDRERLAAVSGGIAQLTSIPATTAGGNPYNILWSNRQRLYNLFIDALSNGAMDDPVALHSLLMTFQGLGIPKAGFGVQLLIGRLGCIDSINQAMIYGGDIPPALKQSIKKGEPGEVRDKMKQASKAYRDMLNEFKDFLGEQGNESQYLWDLWCKMVAFQINNPGVPYAIRMQDPRTKRMRVVGRKAGSLYRTGEVKKYRDFMGMDDDKRVTQRDIARDHYLSATGQLEEEILKIAEELRKMR